MDHDHVHAEHGHPWSPPSELEARVRALESLLIEKGRATPEAIDAIIGKYETEIGPLLGAGVVARAWADEEFRRRLLDDADAVLGELELSGFEAEHVKVVECTPSEHHIVVCTLCSCYPWALLGLPPGWYKSPAYRARAVSEPRAVMAEFGLVLEDGVRVTVWDSSADIRYLVLPLRPEGTEGWSEERLAELVTRDSMIGVSRPLEPEAAAA
ncbi:MAG: nitrile hydratase subunit alpha [Solirubrobacterales bacterium]|nr:nitrile hydratase subunit alpha [Solirubrobacterales bacterium]